MQDKQEKKAARTRVVLQAIKYAGWGELPVAVKEGAKDVFLTFPAIESLLGYPENILRKKLTSKSLKGFVEEGLVPVKITGTVVGKSSAGTPTVSLLSLDDFRVVAEWEAFENRNLAVMRLLSAGMVTNLQSLALRQLGYEIKADEELAWLESRLSGVEARKSFTAVIAENYRQTHPDLGDDEQIPARAFFRPSDRLNIALTGHPAAYWCEKRGIAKQDLRSTWAIPQIKRIEAVESLAQTLIEKGVVQTAADAVDVAIERLMLDVWDEAALFGDGDRATYIRNYRREERRRKSAS